MRRIALSVGGLLTAFLLVAPVPAKALPVSFDFSFSCKIWEMTVDGVLVDVNDNAIITASIGGLFDGEGIAFDSATRTLFVAFENEQQITGLLLAVPEPSTGALLGIAFLALGVAGRRRVARHPSPRAY